jgi:hypothetical protein
MAKGIPSQHGVSHHQSQQLPDPQISHPYCKHNRLHDEYTRVSCDAFIAITAKMTDSRSNKSNTGSHSMVTPSTASITIAKSQAPPQMKGATKLKEALYSQAKSDNKELIGKYIRVCCPAFIPNDVDQFLPSSQILRDKWTDIPAFIDKMKTI